MADSISLHYNNQRALRRHRKSVTYSENEIEVSKKYLANPISVGVWRLEAKWVFNDGISQDLIEAIKDKTPKLRKNKKRISISEVEMQQLFDRTERLSFYIRLFTKLVRRHEATESLDDYIIRNKDEDELIFSMLDLDDFASKYKTALSYFEKNIHFSEITGSVGPAYMTRIKSGNFIGSIGPSDIEESARRASRYNHLYPVNRQKITKIELISLSDVPLEKIGRFFELLGKLTNVERYATFSPEEDLLAPYVQILKIMMPDVLQKETYSQLFTKMLDDHRSGNYTGCISTAGLIAEECMTQIYETLSRSPVPRKMTLGALKQQIGKITETKTSKELTHDSVIGLLEKYKLETEQDITKLMHMSDKIILSYITERYKKLDNKINEI